MSDATGSPADTPPPAQADFTVHTYSLLARGAAVALRLIALLNILYLAAFIVLDIVTGSRGAPPLQVAMGLAVFSGGPFSSLSSSPMPVKAGSRSSPKSSSSRSDASDSRSPWPPSSPSAPFSSPARPGNTARPRLEPLVRATPRAPRSRSSALRPRRSAPSAQSALSHPAIRFATARRTHGRRRWPYFVVKYGLVPLVFAIILFRLHQYIMYGGAFGQYHIYGLGPYLRAFLLRWTGVAGGPRRLCRPRPLRRGGGIARRHLPLCRPRARDSPRCGDHGRYRVLRPHSDVRPRDAPRLSRARSQNARPTRNADRPRSRGASKNPKATIGVILRGPREIR